MGEEVHEGVFNEVPVITVWETELMNFLGYFFALCVLRLTRIKSALCKS